MNLGQAIQSGFQKYANGSGRASRSEYWYWLLFSTLIQVAADLVTGAQSMLSIVVTLALLLPSVAVGIRRLHDIDRLGWFMLLWLIPIIGWIVLIYWACGKGTTGENRFGPDPLAVTSESPVAVNS